MLQSWNLPIFLFGVLIGIIIVHMVITPKEVNSGKEFIMKGNVYKCTKTYSPAR